MSAPFASRADSPLTVTYQGQVLDTSGGLSFSAPTLGVAIFSAATGGTAGYTETQASVPIRNGSFEITIGTGTSRTGSLKTALAGPNAYLELTVNGEIQAPRQRIVSVPFSLVSTDAGTLGGKTAAQVIAMAKGATGPAGPAGPAGAAGPPITTSAICTNPSLVGGALPVCIAAPTCSCPSGSLLVQMSGSCTAVSTSGACSAGVCGDPISARGTCCICRN